MKNLSCPYLRIGSGIRQTDRYACVLIRAATTNIPITGREMLFYTGNQLLGRLSSDGRLEIAQKYACDGYSPTIRFFTKWLRITPTPKKAGFFPAILHDFTRQFCEVEGSPWGRKESDTWFYDVLINGGESKRLAGTYYGAVAKTIGDIWFKFRRHDPSLRIDDFTLTKKP